MKATTHFSVKKVITIIIFSYCAFIASWWLLRLFFFDTYWPLAIVNTTAVYCFMPLPFLLAAALLTRDKKSFVVLLAPLAAFLFLWGTLFLPSLSALQVHSGPALTAMSFNVLYSNKATTELIATISRATPDMIGFQELSPAIKAALASELSATYPYHTFDKFEEKGVGLLSRYPITAVSTFPFPPQELALHAIVDWEGQPVHIFVVHLSANNFFDNPPARLPQMAKERYDYRAAQVTILQEQLTAVADPVILMCDCNFTDSSEAYARLDSLLDDSFGQAGRGFGHTLQPHNIPFRVQRIDYVWHSAHFTAVDAAVGHNGGSDHHPIISTLILRNPGSPQEAQE